MNQQFELFEDFDTLPIYNYSKLLSTNDLRYLIDCKNLPKIENTDWIKEHYNKLIESNLNDNKKQFEFNIKLQKKYFSLIETYRNWFDNKNDSNLEQKIHNKLIDYIDFMDLNLCNFNINGTIYETLKSFYHVYKSGIDYTEFLENCLFVFNYQILKYESRHKFDLYNELPFISKYYGFQIDIRKTSVNEYFSLREKMIENSNKE